MADLVLPTTTPDEGELRFEGTDGVECEEFIHAIKRRARREGKQRDNEWIIDLVSVSLVAEALRWYADLDEDIQEDWKKLQRALLDRWPAPATRGTGSNSSASAFIPMPAAAAALPFPSPLIPDPLHMFSGLLKRTGRIKVVSGSGVHLGYVSQHLADGQLQCTRTAWNALKIEFTSSSAPQNILALNSSSSTNNDCLSVTWYQSTPGPLGKGSISFAKLNLSSDSNPPSGGWPGPTRRTIWSLVGENQLTANWVGDDGQPNILVVSCQASKYIRLTSDFDSFGRNYGLGGSQARLVFEPM